MGQSGLSLCTCVPSGEFWCGRFHRQCSVTPLDGGHLARREGYTVLRCLG